jgi:hypothetical protein
MYLYSATEQVSHFIYLGCNISFQSGDVRRQLLVKSVILVKRVSIHDTTEQRLQFRAYESIAYLNIRKNLVNISFTPNS